MRWINYLGMLILLAALLAWEPTSAQASQLPLQDAVQQGLVRIKQIVGTSTSGFDYAQPMVRITLISTSDTRVTVTLPPGSLLQPTSDGSPMVALGFDPPEQTLDPQTSLDANVIAFTMIVALHTSRKQTFTLSKITSDTKMLVLLRVISDEHTYFDTNLAPQIAVWRIASGENCKATDARVTATFGVALGCTSPEAADVESMIRRAASPDTTSGVSTTDTAIGSTPVISQVPVSSPEVSSTTMIVFGTLMGVVAITFVVLIRQRQLGYQRIEPAQRHLASPNLIQSTSETQSLPPHAAAQLQPDVEPHWIRYRLDAPTIRVDTPSPIGGQKPDTSSLEVL